MGTRADFYLGDGPQAEWLGSVAFDGYEWADDATTRIRRAATPETFRAAVATELAGRRDATRPEQDWPWPWGDSRTTDYAYCFVGDHVEAYYFGRPLRGVQEGDDLSQVPKRADWPDMRSRQNVTLGPRSGLLIMKG